MIEEQKVNNNKDLNNSQEGEDKSPLIVDKRLLFISFKSKIKWIIAISIAFMLLVSLIVTIKIKPVWKANCRIIRMQKNISTPSDMPYLYNAFDINTILETARSRPIIQELMNEFDLNQYKVEEIGRNIEIKRGFRSNVLSFSFSDSDPYRAVALANALGETFINYSTSLQNASADSVYQYYTQEREEKLEIIEELEARILKFQKDNDVISLDSEKSQLYENLKLIQVKKIETQISIDELNAKITDLEEKISSLPDEVILNWTYNETDDKKLVLLKKELELLLARYTPKNPKVMKIQAEIDTLEKRIQDPDRLPDPPANTSWGPNSTIQQYELEKGRYEGELKGARANLLGYEKEIRDIKDNLRLFNSINNSHLELQRQLDLNSDILRIIEGRIAEARMALETNTSDFLLFEPASLPQYPVNLSKKLVVLVSGILMGLFLVVFYISRELFDFRIKSKLDYDKYIDIPLLGSIPAEEGADANRFYANMQYMLDNLFAITSKVPSPPVVTIGSSIPETGKSFIINEFARMISTTGKVLIIECVEELVIEIEDYEINSFLDDDTSVKVKNITKNVDKCYFWLNDTVYRKIYQAQDFNRLYGNFDDYDFIFWELFPSRLNIQLYYAINKSADTNIIVSRFRHSPKVDVFKLVNYLKRKEVKNLQAILNDIPKDYYEENL